MSTITLITGGARSGKSSFAEQLAGQRGQVVYIAPCQALDEEMAERIALHQKRRPSYWRTIEETLELAAAVRSAPLDYCLLVDCLGLWVSNMLLQDEEAALQAPQSFASLLQDHTTELLVALRQRTGPAILVTNEVGMGLVPPYKLGRVFRDCLGRVNALVALQADEVYLCAAGIPLCLKRNGVVLHG